MCEICKKDPCDFRCPNYEKRKSDYYCSICGEGIISGEEYVRNENGDYVHEDCIPGCRWLLRWLGYGLLFSMECNAPYGFSPERKTSFSENSTFTIYNSSDEKYQNYYPIIEIIALSTGKVTLVNNNFPDEIMELNMLKNQKLIIDNKYGKITDESNQFDFSKDTNLVWLKLAPGLNKITVTGNAKGIVKCRYIRKVGI